MHTDLLQTEQVTARRQAILIHPPNRSGVQAAANRMPDEAGSLGDSARTDSRMRLAVHAGKEASDFMRNDPPNVTNRTERPEYKRAPLCIESEGLIKSARECISVFCGNGCKRLTMCPGGRAHIG